MNKNCKIIILSVLVLSIVIAGYILYNKWLESKIGIVSFENVLETEIDGNKYIENKEVGLKFIVPEGWVISKDTTGFIMHTPVFNSFSEELFYVPKDGCWIEVYAENQKEGSIYDLDYSYLKDKIASNYCSRYQNDEQKICVIEEISGITGIRENNFINEGENPGIFTSINIPYSNTIYSFYSHLFGKDREFCLQEFNNFFKTVIIKK